MPTLSVKTPSAVPVGKDINPAPALARFQSGSPNRCAVWAPRALVHALALVAAVPLSVGSVSAASFTISGASTTAQTLSGNPADQTGTITSTGSLTVSGGTVAVTISGNNATLTNLGTISQTGTGRAIRDNTGVTGLLINNGSTTNSTASMQTADADVIQMNKSPASVTLNNYGTMTSLNASVGGAQVVDFNAIQSGSNIVNNYGAMLAQDADAVRPGVGGVVNNSGTIKSTLPVPDTGDDGIDAQTNTGVTIVNAANGSATTLGAGLIEGARHGITGGNTKGTGAYTMSITNNLGGTIQGDNGSGINIDGINGNELVTIVNHGTITGNGVTGDGDGVDVDGLVSITNTGTIKSLNSFNNTSEGVTVGGGTIVNFGTIQGSISTPAGNSGTGRGITIAGVDKDANDNPIPVQAPYGPTTITNSGTIKGDSDSAIAFTSNLVSGFVNTITNLVGGLMEGGGATAAAVQTGADQDTINNYGTIKADSSGKAIDAGAGDDTINLYTGSSVDGLIDGGDGTDTIHLGGSGTGSLGNPINVENLILDDGDWTLDGTQDYVLASLILNAGDLILGDGAGSADPNVYASEVVGAMISGGQVTNITGNGFNIYYDPSLAANTYLGGKSFTLTDGGLLRPLPEPGSIVLLLSGLGLLMFMRGRDMRG